MPIRRLALVSLLAVVSCHETPTEPAVPAEPGIHIESPVSGETIGDTLVLLRGVAEAPGAIDIISVEYDYANQTGNSITFYRFDEHFNPDGTIDSPTRVPFEARLRMNAGAKQVTVHMAYRASRDDKVLGPAERGISVTVPFRIWKKPVLKLEGGLSDTLFQRTLSLQVASVGLDSLPSVDLVVDPGTPGERHVGGAADGVGVISGRHSQLGEVGWLIDLTDALTNGPHRLVVRLSDEVGVADSLVKTFVTHVAPLAYALSPLPGLGGTDADAQDVNTAGDVAGWALDAGGASRAVLWRSDGVSMLPAPSTARSGRAFAMNDAGDVVGSVDDTVGAGYCSRAIRWTAASWRYVSVGTSPCNKLARRINASGATLVVDALGAWSWPDTTAWLERDGALTYFQSLEPSLSLNDRGEVAGGKRESYGNPSPFSSGPNIALPAFRPPVNLGHPAGRLVGLNDASQALGFYSGTSYFAPAPGSALLDLNPYLLSRATLVRLTQNGSVLAFDATDHAAFIWRGGRTYRVALDSTDWVLDTVSAMNDAGVIVGHATQRSTGRTSAVIMRP